MDEHKLQAYLSSEYQGEESFLETIIFPIFGEENYETAWQLPVLEDEELQGMASRTGIKDIIKYGTISVGHVTIDIFDVTVSDSVQMQRNRVGIQQLIRRIMNTYSSAFIIFHYKDNWQLDWRFSFCQKDDKNITEAKRYTFLLGPGQSCRTAAQNFMKLLGKNGNVQRDDIVKAFDVEALSKEFFNKYKEHYDRFCAYVYNNKENIELFGREFTVWEDKTIRDYVKRLLGRIVFLHFLQKKGWMGVPADKPWGEGDRQFMKSLFDKATDEQKANYLDAVLEPLFADALDVDRKANDDLFDCGVEGFRNVKIPYLNGGLFERDKMDEPRSSFSCELFADLFNFLYQYNFTIDENDPNDAEVGIDPEMLGRIFENLLEDNKDKGAFYTPKEIVQYMCKESLIAYLQTDVESEDVRQRLRDFVRTYDVAFIGGADSQTARDVDDNLKAVKICDPAIGSGAFPMGLMKELYLCRSAIEGFDGKKAAEIKKHIIQQNIYGVDIEKGAVDIARLRFWLSLVLDEETPHALPNLDFKIMQGNSLLEQYKGVDLSQIMQTKKKVEGSVQLTFFDNDIDELRRQLVALRNAYYRANNKQEKIALRASMRNIVQQQINAQFINVELGNIDIAETSEFFLWHTWFSEVFDKGGFDIVIGNPPYIQLQADKGKLGKLYDKKGFGSFFKTGDIYCLFIEQAGKLAKVNGVISYINPNTWLQSISFAPIRKYITSNLSWISTLITNKVFANATVDTHCLLFRKAQSAIDCAIFKMNKEGEVSFLHNVPSEQIRDKQDAINIEADQCVVKLIKTILTHSKRLDEYCKVYSGVNPFEKGKGKPAQTAEMVKNHVYVKDGEKPANNWTPLLRGSLMHRYVNYWDNNYWILYGENLAAPRDPKIFEAEEKIIVRQTGDSIIATIIGKNIICRKNLHICVPNNSCPSIKFLLGVMNSKLIDFVYQYMNPEKGEALAEVKKAHVENLPIPSVQIECQQTIITLVDRILSTKKANPQADTTAEEREIDRLVYDLYGLTEEEIAIVEGTK